MTALDLVSDVGEGIDDDADESNRALAIAAAGQLLTALGVDVDAPDLLDTPRRMVESLSELLTPREFAATTFANDQGYDEIVLARGIPFSSLSRRGEWEWCSRPSTCACRSAVCGARGVAR